MPSSIDIPHLLARLDTIKEDAPVILGEDKGEWNIEAAGRLITLRARKADHDALITFIREAILQEAGTSAALEAEKLLRASLEEHTFLIAGHCRQVLKQYAVKGSAADDLKTFVEEMPQDSLQAMKFSAMSPYAQLAVMHGVRKGVEMMQNVNALVEIDGGMLDSGSMFITLETMQTAQKTLAKAITTWAHSIRQPLPDNTAKRDMPEVMQAVIRLLLVTQRKELPRFLETLTAGPVADIFSIQQLMVKALLYFSENVALPSGMDAKGPAQRLALLRELLFEAACGYVRRQKGLSKTSLIASEANALLQPDARRAMGRLLRLYLNTLLREIPPEAELKPRVKVKGFLVEGLHESFINDCIARRFSFTIEGHGKVENAPDRESAVARGKRDMEFYESKMREWEASGTQNGSPSWERPTVRSSAAITPEDMSAAFGLILDGIPERSMRMAVTAIANQASIGILSAFFGKDPFAGVNLVGSNKQMTMDFDPATGRLHVVAILLHDAMQSIERHGDGEDEDEISLGQNGFTEFEFYVTLKKEKSPSWPDGFYWTASKVSVENILPNFFIPV